MIKPNLPSQTPRQIALRKRLKRKSGATVAELQKALGWQPHSVRAAVSGLRRAGDTVELFQSPRGNAYRIVRPEAGR
jgi:hypothetical protein